MTSSFVCSPPRREDDFKGWLRRSNFLKDYDVFTIDNTKTPLELENSLREQAQRLIAESSNPGEVHGHLYHILYPPSFRDRAAIDSEFGKHYAESSDADPRLLISACAIQYLVLVGKIGDFQGAIEVYLPGTLKEEPWKESIKGLSCVGNDTALSECISMAFGLTSKPTFDYPNLINYIFPEGIPGDLTKEDLNLFLIGQMKEKINGLSFSDQVVCYEHLASFLKHPVDHAWINNFHPKQLNALVVGFMMTRIKALEPFLKRAGDMGFNIGNLDEMKVHLNWALERYRIDFKLLREEGRVEFNLLAKINAFFTPHNPVEYLRLRRSLTTIRPMVLKTITNTDGSVNGQTIDVATQGLSDSERDTRMAEIVLGNDTDSSRWAHEIIPGLWVGARQSATEVGTKFQRNIHVTGGASRAPDPSLVTTYSVGDPTDRTPGPHMEYVRILSGPAYKESDPSTWFQKVFAEMDFALSKGETLLVNCTVGESRSVTLVCAYLMNRVKGPLAAVLPFIQSKRITAEPVPKLFAILQAYEDYCIDPTRRT